MLVYEPKKPPKGSLKHILQKIHEITNVNA